MANNLIFPIGFDLEKGVADAQMRMDAALKRLQKTVDGKPLTIPMRLDASKFTTFEAALRGSIQHITDDAKNLKAALDSSLQTDNSANINRITEAMRNLEAAWKALPNNQKFDINDRLTPKAQEMVRQFNELATASSTYGQTLSQIAGKIKRVADEEAKANQKRNDGYAKLRKTLGAQENSIANLSAKIKAYQQILNSKEIGSKSFERVAEKIRELTEQLDNAKTKVAELTGKAQSGASRQAAAVRQVSQEFNKQDSYLTNLLKKTAALWSIHQVGSFLTSVREVTAQFELQRVSLGAILQDQNKANQLFSEIKSFALKSPVSILDLTKYTKQLAAYKVGWDGVKTDTKELFEWTKKLTDVSVGLGVSMDRVVLAFGQVRATGYLRGCLGRGTSVKMFDGSNKKVEDVLVGDAIMGDDGQKRNVLSLVRNRETMYVVKFDGGSFRCNENHILTLYNINSGIVEDVYVLDYLKYPALYKGVKYTNGGYEYFDMSVERDCEDDYFGFEIDGNKRFIIEGNIVTHNSEVRQFTEMGVPIVEELAEKLKKLNGEAVTTEQVMDMISKRAISFDMVKDVFDDMTSAGGMFYNMQETQGNTLYGMWAKLGDAASVMYDEIGNTESINKGMKAAIQALTDLMRNWQQIPRMMAFAGAATLVFVTRQKILKLETAKVAAIQETYNARMARTNMLLSSSSRLTRAHGFALGVQARMLKMASTAAAAFGTSLTAITSAIISTGWGALIMALGYVADKLLFTKTNAEKAAEAISKISEETATETAKSVRNFEYLANKAVNAPKGSTEQKEALEELERTYSNILPKELLELEYLDKLDGKYGSLTKTIREYIAEQQRRKAVEEIGDVYGAEKQKYERKLTGYFREQGWTEGEIARFWEKFYDVAKDKSKTLQQAIAEALKFAGRETTVFADMAGLLKNQDNPTRGLDKKSYKAIGWSVIGNVDYIDLLRDAVLEENKELEQSEERLKANTNATNAFAEAQEKAAKRLKEVRLEDLEGKTVDRDSYLGGQLLANFEIKGMTNILKDGFAKAELAWDAEYGNFINQINAKTPEIISTLNFDAITDALIKALDNDKLTEEKRKYLEDLLSLAQQSKKRYEEIVPADPIVRVAQARFKQIAQSAGGFREEYSQYLMKAGEDMATYNKRLKDSLENLENRVKALLDTQKVIAKAGTFAKLLYGVSAEELQKDIEDTNKTISIIEKTLSEQSDYSRSKKKKDGTKGTKSDPRLQNLKEEISLTKKLYDEYHKLERQIGATQAKSKIQEYYANTIADLEKRAKGKYGFTFALPFTDENLKANIRQYISAMEKLQKEVDKKGRPKFPTVGKEIDEAKAMLGAIDTDSLSKRIEKQLKELSDRISRTKTAKEFYEKILSATGNVDMAINLTTSIFGENGQDLNEQIALQINGLMQSGEGGIEIGLDVVGDGYNINYKNLRKLTEEAYKAKKIGDQAYKDLIAIADNGEKDVSKMVDGWLKATEKAKSYSDKLLDLARTTNAEIAKIEAQRTAGNITDDYAKAQIQGYKDKQAQEIAKLQYEAFKDSPMYVQMFDDLDNASTTMLRNMKQRIEELKTSWKDLTPTQLKEMQSRLNEIDTQLAKRNPFKGLIDGIKEYRNLRKGGDTLGNKSEGAAEKALDAAAKARLEAEKEYLEILNREGTTQEEIADAKKRFDDAAADEDAAAKALENWKKVKDAIGLSANELFQMLNWAGDIAKGIADISEAMGADEEDVQYWNDVSDALGQISGGIQDIVSAAMSGNVVGIISSTLTAIPKMFVGFANLFSAGKIKRANKEIKRQQQLLEQLEYTYGRLEAATDKVFGRDYLNNYNQQLKNLQAQQAAYEKQARAERSKGKKKDKDKIKEYEEQARETADKIKELQDDLVAHFTGSSRTDVARQMAQSWIDARASMSDTFAAIKGDYQDLIKNMIVEGAAARVIENALTPVWDSMEAMLAKNDVEGAIDSLVNGMDSALNAANNGMEVLWKALEARGYDMKSLISDTDSEYTGIAKSVAGATSEEILQLSGFVNTALYHTAYLPKIYEELVAMRTASLPTATVSAASAGWTDWQQQAMDNYNAIARNTADTVVECRRAADACEELARAVKTKGSTTGFNTFLNS